MVFGRAVYGLGPKAANPKLAANKPPADYFAGSSG